MSAEHGQDSAVDVTEDDRPSRRERFRQWRRTRPFWAGLITAFAGLWLIWSPQAAIGGLNMTIGVLTDGWLIGALLVILAVGMWLQPQVRGLAGAMVIVLALGSFIKINFGGFLIGMLAGLIGGAMAIAWAPDRPADELLDEPETRDVQERSSDQLLPMSNYRPADPGSDGALGAEPADRTAAEPEPAPVRRGRRAAPSETDVPGDDSGRTTISLLATVALVPVMAALVALGGSGVASGQEGTPTVSPTASPSEPPSPTPTPTETPSEQPPSPSPTATPSTSPTAEPSPTVAPKRIRAAATDPQPAGMTGHLTADSSAMSGLSFGGIVTYDTPHGAVRALRFTADSNELNDMTLRVTIRGVTTTIKDGDNETTVLSGHVVMDVTSLAGDLGGVPVEFTPDSPPPLVPSTLELTDLSAGLLLVQADSMDVPKMTQELS